MCRKEGRRLRESEWAAPVVGRLVIRNTRGEDTNFKRNIRRAELLAPAGAYSTVQVDAVKPIFDPELLPAPPGKLLIRGIELASGKGEAEMRVMYEWVQLWLCTPLDGSFAKAVRAAVT